MLIEPGLRYICDLTIDMGLFGKHDVEVVIDVDDETSFHGTGRLKEDSFVVLGYRIDPSMRLVFDHGTIDGNDCAFSVFQGGASATFTAHVAESGAVTGTATALGLLHMRFSGSVVDVCPIP